MKKYLFIASYLFLQLSAFTQQQSSHALLVGDKAPVFPLDKWIKGGPFNIYDKKKVYLIDFWATWCGPCIAGMKHLTELQKKYKDKGLEVIGATSEDAWGNSYDKVINFIQSRGKEFDYNFAWLPDSYRSDRKYRSVIYHPWIELAYDSSSWALPQIFIVDKEGRIAFIGDGYSLTENYLEKILEDSHDIKDERNKYIQKIILDNKILDFQNFLAAKNQAESLRAGTEIVNDPNVSAHTLLVLCESIFDKHTDMQSPELLKLGMKAAKKGVELTGSRSPSQLATLAKAYALLKNRDQAISTLKLAIALAESDFKAALEKDLIKYQSIK
jgi:thiol-disulfide isomerase/thioredoxin